MSKNEIIEFCLTLPNTFEDKPFNDNYETIVMKHNDNKKWYALIMEVQDKIYLNVKTIPEYSELLRSTYEYIVPGYHMNKQHWNSIIISDKVDVSLVQELIEQSYELTRKNSRK